MWALLLLAAFARSAEIRTVTVEQMRAVDALAPQLGVTLPMMMENAGRSLAELAAQTSPVPLPQATVVVLAGPGNNGGGGLVAARHLESRGARVIVVRPGEVPPAQAHVVIDALIGYGLKGAPRPAVAALIGWANAQKAPVISLDVPSGIEADTGRAPGAAIRPAKTLTLALPKPGLTPQNSGELYLADIGLPSSIYANLGQPSPFTSGPIVRLGDAPALLTSPNPVSASTLADSGVTHLFVDAETAARGELAAVVKAARKPVIGVFLDPKHVEMKPKLDEGLEGAVLSMARSLKDVLRFLKRVYLPPLGERSVGPSDATGYLAHAKEFIAGNNDRFEAGIELFSPQRADVLLKAKARGLKFVVTPDEEVARKAEAAGLRVFRRVPSDLNAVDAAFDRYADVPVDPAKEILQLGFLMSPDRGLARRMAERASGLWIDAEDGQFTLEKVKHMISVVPAGKPAYVRAVEWNDPHIAAYVAAGAAGVVAPQVSHAWQARAFIETVKRADPAAKAVVMIETARGLSNLEEILSVPGIDVLFIGPNDLALSLRTTQDSPQFKAAVAKIEDAARRHGIALGGLSKKRSETYASHDRGYRFVTTVSDQTALRTYFAPQAPAPSH